MLLFVVTVTYLHYRGNKKEKGNVGDEMPFDEREIYHPKNKN